MGIPARDVPEPCTDEAYEQDCSCTIPFPGPCDIDPPEPKIDTWCPLHGSRDADREYDAWKDREIDAA